MTLHIISTRNFLNALKRADAFSVKAILSPETYGQFKRECLVMGQPMEKIAAELVEKYIGSWVPDDIRRCSTEPIYKPRTELRKGGW